MKTLSSYMYDYLNLLTDVCLVGVMGYTYYTITFYAYEKKIKEKLNENVVWNNWKAEGWD